MRDVRDTVTVVKRVMVSSSGSVSLCVISVHCVIRVIRVTMMKSDRSVTSIVRSTLKKLSVFKKWRECDARGRVMLLISDASDKVLGVIKE